MADIHYSLPPPFWVSLPNWPVSLSLWHYDDDMVPKIYLWVITASF